MFIQKSQGNSTVILALWLRKFSSLGILEKSRCFDTKNSYSSYLSCQLSYNNFYKNLSWNPREYISSEMQGDSKWCFAFIVNEFS